MDNYEKRIGLKTIWQTIVRRWKVIFLIFIPVAIASFVVTQFIMDKKYSASYTLDNVTNFDNNGYNKVVSIIQKEETISLAVEKLATTGKKVTVSQITSGMSIPNWTKNTRYIEVSFVSKNKDIIKPILTSLSEASLEVLQPSYSSMYISSKPSNPTVSSNNKTYLIIGIAAGAVLALGFAFVDEIISDEVYDKEDIEYLGSPAFEITASK